jgi:hypothetical protein
VTSTTKTTGFQKATKKATKLRLALLGPAGSGKTYSALKIARGLGAKIAVIDTEHGTARKYSGDVADFDVIELETFAPEEYVRWIVEAEAAGYDVLVIDSMSHAWSGKGGILEFVDGRKKNGNGFAAWGDATPKHNRLVEAILAAKLHIVVTMRTKMEYVQEKDDRTGKMTVRKVGLQPVQRDGLEYEFDVVGDMTTANELVITKTRCSALNQAIIDKPDEKLAATLLRWLSDGEPAPAAAPRLAVVPPPATPAKADPAHAPKVVEAPKQPSSTELMFQYAGRLDACRTKDEFEKATKQWADTKAKLAAGKGGDKKAAILALYESKVWAAIEGVVWAPSEAEREDLAKFLALRVNAPIEQITSPPADPATVDTDFRGQPIAAGDPGVRHAPNADVHGDDEIPF